MVGNQALLRRKWVWELALLSAVLPVLAWVISPSSAGWQNLTPIESSLSRSNQFVLVIAVYGIKLIYMLLSLGAFLMLWGESRQAWKSLRYSLAAFWMGEFFCWINIVFFVEESVVFEYLHSFLMVLSLSLLFYSLMEAVDDGLLHFSDPKAKCALVRVCEGCVKAQTNSMKGCFLHRLFQWMIPLAAIVAWMPWIAEPLNYSFETEVFGFPRILTHLMPIQWYELRFCPIAALVLLAAAWLALIWRSGTQGGIQVSKILLSAGAGHLSFSFMRLAFASFYRERLVWFIFWEELTELILIVGVLVVILSVRSNSFSHLWKKLEGWSA